MKQPEHSLKLNYSSATLSSGRENITRSKRVEVPKYLYHSNGGLKGKLL